MEEPKLQPKLIWMPVCRQASLRNTYIW